MIHPADPENEHQEVAWRTWREIRPFLERDHVGEYALVRDDKVVGFFPTAREALAEGLNRYPPSTFLVRGIATPEVVEPMFPLTYTWPEIPPKPEAYFHPPAPEGAGDDVPSASAAGAEADLDAGSGPEDDEDPDAAAGEADPLGDGGEPKEADGPEGS